ncbi:MAG: 2Fe-2S iron-sulfur cluster-binding protein [Novosphingobium sp.]|uniref:2Fe-2S iron-sulfur cluster-binding protein n=1 Tax=Novosphingobium sp. TaxID=1874826 RepID=UPI003C7C958D
MTKVTFIDFAGTTRMVDALPGTSVADAALAHAVPGIEADCGGFCACATCHVYLDDTWFAKVPPIEELEAHMLEHAVGRRANSRLSCQLRLSDALDGIVVHTPEHQYL